MAFGLKGVMLSSKTNVANLSKSKTYIQREREDLLVRRELT
jgi:hypothetical protein